MANTKLLHDIETFLARTGMGPAYFGKTSCRNSELVARLRAGGRVWPETEKLVRDFMRANKNRARAAA